jgi:hypothetical protein
MNRLAQMRRTLVVWLTARVKHGEANPRTATLCVRPRALRQASTYVVSTHANCKQMGSECFDPKRFQAMQGSSQGYGQNAQRCRQAHVGSAIIPI